jgi:hypothetical protein
MSGSRNKNHKPNKEGTENVPSIAHRRMGFESNRERLGSSFIHDIHKIYKPSAM